VAGGGLSLMTWEHSFPQAEDVWGRTPTDLWDVAIASGAYPTNGYSLDPANWGQLNRFKTITDVYFSGVDAPNLAINWTYDSTNKSMRGYQQGGGAGPMTELSGTVGPFELRCRFFGF
jgi:hypothetical protein